MKIAVACDHGGLNLKKSLIAYLQKNGHEVADFGTDTFDSCDYPDFAVQAAEAVAFGDCDRGIVVCSSGIGVSIVANKVPGIRCAHCHDLYCAKYTRYHNDANMIAFGEKVIGVGMMEEIVNAFLTCEYEGGERHDRRIAKIKAIEEKYCYKQKEKTLETPEIRALKQAKDCADVYKTKSWKETTDSYEAWCERKFGIARSTAYVYKDVYDYVSVEGVSVLAHGDLDFNAWQISALVKGLKDKKIIKEACKLELVTPHDDPVEIKKKCNAWKNGEFFFKTDWSILSQIEGENYNPYESHHMHKIEEKFIVKYFKK
jgi:ribose 5-phosphate isomerase B